MGKSKLINLVGLTRAFYTRELDGLKGACHGLKEDLRVLVDLSSDWLCNFALGLLTRMSM